MENPTYDPNSVSNMLSFLTLPEFLTEMTAIMAPRCLTPRKIKPIITVLAYS